MRPNFIRSTLLVAIALALPASLPAAEDAPPVNGTPPATDTQADVPADPVTELRQRFAQLAQEHPLLAKTDCTARFDKTVAQVVAAQAAVIAAAALDGDGAKRAQLAAQKIFDQRLIALDQLVNESEFTAEMIAAQTKLDAHPPAVAKKDDVGARLAAVKVELLAAFAKQSAAQNDAQRLRHQADGLDLDAEGFDAQADQRSHLAEVAAEEFGKVNEQEGKTAHAKELAAARTRQLDAVRAVHDAQREALHQRQEAELVRLQADAIDDQWEQAHEGFEAQRQILGEVSEAIDQVVEALAQAAGDK